MRTLFSSLLVPFSAGLLAAQSSEAPSASATPSAADDVVALQDFVITTSSGVSEDLRRVPVAVDLVAPADAAAIQPMWIGETLNRLPGVYIAKLRGPVDAPAIRLPVSYENYYLYLQDGVPLQSTVGFNHAAYAYSGALTSHGGIELLRGPGTALHGSDAIAAVINVRSLEPTGALCGSARIAGGSWGAFEMRGEVSDRIAANQTARAAVSFAGEEGWRDTTAWQRLQGIVRHDWTGENTRVESNLAFTDFDSEMAAALTEAAYEENPRSDGLDPRVPRDQARDTAKYLRLSSMVTHEFSDTVRLQVTPFYRRIDASYMHTWEPATVPVTSEVSDTLAMLGRVYVNWIRDGETVIGLDVEGTELDSHKEQIVEDTIVWGQLYPQGSHYQYTVDFMSVSPYVQHAQRFGAVTVTAGLRYDDASYDYTNHLPDGEFGALYRPASRKDTFSQLNPKLGVAWQLSDSQAVFARYAHGFRLPMAYELYALYAGQTDFRLKPVQADNYDLGYRGQLNAAVAVQASAYFMRMTDGITTDVDNGAGLVSANGGVREFRGLEFQVDARLSREFSATASLGLQDHVIVKDRPDGSDPRGVNGNRPNSSSGLLGNVTLRYAPAALEGRLTLEWETQFLGSWWIDDQNTRRTPDEWIHHLRARYAFGERWALAGKVLNVFDNDYYTTAADAGYGARYRPANPVSFTLGLEAAW